MSKKIHVIKGIDTVKWVISEHTTTDGKRLLYLAEDDGRTCDVDVIKYEVKDC